MEGVEFRLDWIEAKAIRIKLSDISTGEKDTGFFCVQFKDMKIVQTGVKRQVEIVRDH